jgi:2'-5' RNA ligase
VKPSETNKTFRAFIGVPIPLDIQNKITSLIQPLKKIDALEILRWQPPENWHITLRFLGDIQEEKRQPLIAAIQSALKDTAPFSLNFSSLKLFPNPKSPIALVLQPEHVIDLTVLAIKIDKASNSVGFESEKRAFKPHLTLARIDRKKHASIEINVETIKVPNLSFTTNQIHLYKSDRTENGSRYTIVETIKS